jgi:hypothetical protein
MEFIRTIRTKAQTKRQENIQRQSEEDITLTDFNESLYIAYLGIPLIPIQEEWSPKTIMEELGKIRQNYINAKLKQVC